MRQIHNDLVWHPINKPTQHTSPVCFVRHVINGNIRVHLPHPRILHRKRQYFARTVALERKHYQFFVSVCRVTCQKCGCTRLHFRDRVDNRDRWQFPPASSGSIFRVSNLCRRVCGTSTRRFDSHLDKEALVAITPCFIKHNGEDISHWRSCVTALTKRAMTAQHQKSTAAVINEVRYHPQLIGCEVIGFDTAKNDAAILVEFRAGTRKPADEIIRPFDIEPHKLIFCRTLQNRYVKILIIRDSTTKKLHFEPWFAFKIQ